MTSCINYSKWDQLDDGDLVVPPQQSPPRSGAICDRGSQQARPKLTKQDMREAARHLLLRGARSDPGSHAMGVYVMQDDTLVNGRPYYQQEDDSGKCRLAHDNMIWASGSGLVWLLGAPRDLGTTRCLLSLRDDGGALLPERATGVWSVWTGGAWVDEASISCVTLASAVEELKPAAAVYLVGSVPNDQASRVEPYVTGQYQLRPELVNGRPSYSLTRGDRTLKWVGGFWAVGSNSTNFCEEAALARCAGAALLPQLAASCWVVMGESSGEWVDAP